jgi:hydroxymethylbilane synthase
MAAAALARVHPKAVIDLIPMSTTGDERLQWSLEVRGGKGLFTSELERAILAGEADFAVHSAKDLPTEMEPGLEIAGYLPRANPYDVLVLREGVHTPAVMATGSPRRRSQLSRMFPGALWEEIRGNVGTRLQKLADGAADGGMLAAAGLSRLGIERFPGLVFRQMKVEECVPAAGQGAIAIQCRSGEADVWKDVVCAATAEAVTIERTALAALGGGCHSASAAHFVDGVLYLFDESFGARHLTLAEKSPEAVRDAVKSLLNASSS